MPVSNFAVKSAWVSLLFLSLAACAAMDGQETTGEYLDDATITAKVKAAFIGDSQIKAFQINVETLEGVVQLSGFVDSAASETHAVDITQHIRGVKSVKDSLVIAPKAAD